MYNKTASDLSTQSAPLTVATALEFLSDQFFELSEAIRNWELSLLPDGTPSPALKDILKTSLLEVLSDQNTTDNCENQKFVEDFLHWIVERIHTDTPSVSLQQTQ